MSVPHARGICGLVFALSALGLVTASATGSAELVRGSGLCDGLTPTIVGTPGPDDLEGTPGDDVITGLGGQDSIDGLGGDDVICGGPNNDFLIGGEGDDRLFGQGNGGVPSDSDSPDLVGDTLQGGPGSDLLNVGAVNRSDEDIFDEPEIFDFSDLTSRIRVDLTTNSATAADGDVDTLKGFVGVNHRRLVIGTPYNDVMIGTRDDDDFSGGDGNDLLRGRTGEDILKGGDGDDRLYGGHDHDGSRDPIEPTSGGDQIWPGPGTDLIKPGGHEKYAYSADELHYDDVVHGVRVDLRHSSAQADGVDTLILTGAIQVYGSAFDDVLIGNHFNDTIYGLAGDDRLYGWAGHDELYGDGDFDISVRGVDTLRGGRNTDFLNGGPMGDTMRGGQGDDAESDRPAVNTCISVELHYPRGC